MEIYVRVSREEVIPETAELIGMSEAELRKRFKAADGALVFKIKVSAEQWENILSRKRRGV